MKIIDDRNKKDYTFDELQIGDLFIGGVYGSLFIKTDENTAFNLIASISSRDINKYSKVKLVNTEIHIIE